jgi:hypothetical protein
MQVVVFWVVTSCSTVGGYRRFGETLIPTCNTTLLRNPDDHNPQRLSVSENKMLGRISGPKRKVGEYWSVIICSPQCM